ncbi:MAG: C4-type zinc ribbon domain-containing protein [Sediminibacterium sp.]
MAAGRGAAVVLRACLRTPALRAAPVERDACGGCFNSIPPQRQSEIRLHKKIIVCENCGRILVDADLNDTVEAK